MIKVISEIKTNTEKIMELNKTLLFTEKYSPYLVTDVTQIITTYEENAKIIHDEKQMEEEDRRRQQESLTINDLFSNELFPLLSQPNTSEPSVPGVLLGVWDEPPRAVLTDASTVVPIVAQVRSIFPSESLELVSASAGRASESKIRLYRDRFNEIVQIINTKELDSEMIMTLLYCLNELNTIIIKDMEDKTSEQFTKLSDLIEQYKRSQQERREKHVLEQIKQREQSVEEQTRKYESGGVPVGTGMGDIYFKEPEEQYYVDFEEQFFVEPEDDTKPLFTVDIKFMNDEYIFNKKSPSKELLLLNNEDIEIDKLIIEIKKACDKLNNENILKDSDLVEALNRPMYGDASRTKDTVSVKDIRSFEKEQRRRRRIKEEAKREAKEAAQKRGETNQQILKEIEERSALDLVSETAQIIERNPEIKKRSLPLIAAPALPHQDPSIGEVEGAIAVAIDSKRSNKTKKARETEPDKDSKQKLRKTKKEKIEEAESRKAAAKSASIAAKAIRNVRDGASEVKTDEGDDEDDDIKKSTKEEYYREFLRQKYKTIKYKDIEEAEYARNMAVKTFKTNYTRYVEGPEPDVPDSVFLSLPNLKLLQSEHVELADDIDCIITKRKELFEKRFVYNSLMKRESIDTMKKAAQEGREKKRGSERKGARDKKSAMSFFGGSAKSYSISSLKIKSKYLKYKNKYLELKHKLEQQYNSTKYAINY